MGKKITLSKIKPPEILELERKYKITFHQTILEELINDEYHTYQSYFCITDKNIVNALGIGRINLASLNLLKKFKELEYLSLTSCGIKDIAPIFPQPLLKYLYLGGNEIKDISC